MTLYRTAACRSFIFNLICAEALLAFSDFFLLHRKEVIHPLVLEGIPCFDLTPITGPALDAALPYGLG